MVDRKRTSCSSCEFCGGTISRNEPNSVNASNQQGKCTCQPSTSKIPVFQSQLSLEISNTKAEIKALEANKDVSFHAMLVCKLQIKQMKASIESKVMDDKKRLLALQREKKRHATMVNALKEDIQSARSDLKKFQQTNQQLMHASQPEGFKDQQPEEDRGCFTSKGIKSHAMMIKGCAIREKLPMTPFLPSISQTPMDKSAQE